MHLKNYTNLKIGIWLCALLAWMAPAPSAASDEPGDWNASLGFDYSHGDYGEATKTDILYLPLSVAYSSGAWTAKATVPFLSVDGPLDFATLDGAGAGQAPGSGSQHQPPPDPEPPPRDERVSGIGDVVLALTYAVDRFYDYDAFVDLTLALKVPTADEGRALGTGEFDYTASLDVGKTWGKWTPLVMAGYRVVGRSHEFDLQNTFIGSVGVQYAFAAAADDPSVAAPTVGVSFDYRESLARGASDPAEALGYVSLPLSKQWTLLVYSVGGISDGSPDFGLGTSLSFRPAAD